MTVVPVDFEQVPMIQSPGDVAVNEQKCVCKDRGLEKGGDAE